jgi:hypothetical protein
MRTWPSSEAVCLARSEVPAGNPNRSFMKIKSIAYAISSFNLSKRS